MHNNKLSEESIWYIAAAILTVVVMCIIGYNLYDYYLVNRDPVKLDQVVDKGHVDSTNKAPIYLVNKHNNEESPLNKKADILIQCQAMAHTTEYGITEYYSYNKLDENLTKTIIAVKTMQYFIWSIYGGRFNKDGEFDGDLATTKVTLAGIDKFNLVKKEFLENPDMKKFNQCLTWMKNESTKNDEYKSMYLNSLNKAKEDFLEEFN